MDVVTFGAATQYRQYRQQDWSVGNGSFRGSGGRTDLHGGSGPHRTKHVDPASGAPSYCVVISNPTEGAASSCASDVNATHLWVSSCGTGSARVVVADDIIPDGWTKLGDFLIVNPEE